MVFENPMMFVLSCEAEKRAYGREDCSAGWNNCCFSGN